MLDDKCTSCDANSPRLSAEQTDELLNEIPGWTIKQFDNENHLVKSFKFDDFAKALNFTIQVGDLAEEAGHHPTLITAWGKVIIHWWTHAIGGLHRNDFVMAQRTDRLFNKLTNTD